MSCFHRLVDDLQLPSRDGTSEEEVEAVTHQPASTSRSGAIPSMP